MKNIILILLLTVFVNGLSQPSNNGNGNGHNNPHPCNPHDPHCQPSVPISGIWILLLAGAAAGVHYIVRKRKPI